MKLPITIDLKGKTAVVTGGGGVLCSEFAKALAACGANVAVCDLREDAAQKIVDEIKADGGSAIAVAANVLSKESLLEAKAKIEAAFGGVDILLNGAEGIEYSIMYKGERMDISLPIPGRFTVYNSLSAISCALGFGIGKDVICRALSSMSPVGGRIEKVDIDTDFSVFIDFAHTPDALENVLNTVRGFAKGRIITLFGCGGDRDKTKRPLMGGIAAAMADHTVVTSDNSRTEDPSAIIADIVKGIPEGSDYEVIENRTEALRRVVLNARKDDIILVAGKGHENYEITADGKHPFSEKEIIVKAFEEREGR